MLFIIQGMSETQGKMIKIILFTAYIKTIACDNYIYILVFFFHVTIVSIFE